MKPLVDMEPWELERLRQSVVKEIERRIALERRREELERRMRGASGADVRSYGDDSA